MTSTGTWRRVRRVIACALAALLVAGLVPALPQALAEEPGAVLELADGTEDGLEIVGAQAPDEAGPAGEDVVVIAAADDDPGVEVQATELGVKNPSWVPDESKESGQVVTWDCVWFGSYPQGEVAPGDAEYETLEGLDDSAWDANGDATVGGERYRRISRSDATYDGHWYDDGYGDATYRYFRYEPIKWRVLKDSETTALVVSDVVLDDQEYSTTPSVGVTWETSSIRSWLNGYGESSNQPGTDFTRNNFMGAAFSSGEKSAILQTSVANANNTQYGTGGGNGTEDEVFLLSEAEVCDTSYGFVSDPDTKDEARRCMASDYACAMGALCLTDVGYEGNCLWWLRSPGRYAYYASCMFQKGYVYSYGLFVHYFHGAVRPALNLDLSSPCLQAAGTVSSDWTVDEVPHTVVITSVTPGVTSYTYDGKAKEPTLTVMAGEEVVPASGYDAVYEKNVDAGTATVTVAGKGDYSGTATATFAIKPASIAKAKVTLKKTSYTYDGKAKKPKVKSIALGGRRLKAGTDYAVSYKDNARAGTATAIVKGRGNYKGTAKATFQIAPAKVPGLSTDGHPSMSAIEASWEAAAGAGSYELSWRRAGGKWSSKSVKGTSATAKGLKANGLYEVRVRAKAGSVAGAWTKPARRWLRKVSSLRAAAGTAKGTIDVRWAADAQATGGYVAYACAKKDGAAVAQATVAAGETSATIKGLKPGKAYYVRVRPLRKASGSTYVGVLRYCKTTVKAK